MLKWINENKAWLFDGVGVFVIGFIYTGLRLIVTYRKIGNNRHSNNQTMIAPTPTQNASTGQNNDSNLPVDANFDPVPTQQPVEAYSLFLVRLDKQQEVLGWPEIGNAFLFGVFLSGINILQRVYLSTSAPGLEKRDVIILNITMGISAFFLTSTLLLFISYESEKISLFIRGFGKRVLFLYLTGLALIEVVSHFDTFSSFGSPIIMLAFSHLMFFSVSVIETIIDLQIAACFDKVSNHYKEYAEIYRDASKYALITLGFNLVLSVAALLAYFRVIPNIDSLNTIFAMSFLNLYFLFSVRLKIIKASVQESNVQNIPS